jgi:peptide/nickel transport system permease protein
MLAWLFKRILSTLPLLLVVSIMGFTLMRYHVVLGPMDLSLPTGQVIHVMDRLELKHPVDPLANLRQNPQITPEALHKEETRLGLTQPMWQQYLLWLASLVGIKFSAVVSGHWQDVWQPPSLGQTMSGEPVIRVMSERAGNTLLLNIVAMVLTWGLAIPIGVLSANAARSRLIGSRLLDQGFTLISALGLAIPGFVVALLLAVVAVKTRWFPLGGLQSDMALTWPLGRQIIDIIWHLMLPALVLSIGGIASLQRQMRANFLEVSHADYVRMAQARGLPPQTVLFRHALPNALNPMITLFGFELASLLSGAVLVETVLGYPGLGALTYQAALQGDVNLVMASLILSATLLVLGNLIADLLLAWIDPRISLS